jgi:hypothetical protein
VIDQFYPKYVAAPASEIYKAADALQKNEWLVVKIQGTNVEGNDIAKTVALPMGEGADGRDRIRDAGVTIVGAGNELQIANVKFGSRAKKLGVEQGYNILAIELPNRQRPSQNWVFVPAGLLVALIWSLQRGRAHLRVDSVT